MGCSPSGISNPAAVIASRNRRVFRRSRSRGSSVVESSDTTSRAAETIAGARVFENR